MALILGAGASRPFGFPITAEILPEILRRLRARRLFPRGPGTSARDAREATRELRAALERLAPGLFRDGVEPPLITDLLSLIDHLIASGNTPRAGLGPRELDRLRALLEAAVAEVLAEPTHRADEHENRDLLDRFVAWMAGHARGRPLALVTTNYDVVIEQQLYRVLRARRLPVDIDFGLQWRPAGGRVPLQRRPAAPWLGLYKLHGSLDWLKCPLCGHLTIDPARTLFRSGEHVGRATALSCACGYGPLRHLIVTPSMVRDVRDPNLLALWDAALEALRTAEEWVVIGYSLPAEDVAIRSLLLRAYWGRPHPPRLRVVERGHNREVESRYRMLFPELAFETGGVQGFIETLPRRGAPPAPRRRRPTA